MAAREEVIPFTRAHAQQLEDELNASRVLHEQMREQVISQRTFLQQQSDAISMITDQLGRITTGGVGGFPPKYNIKFDTFAFEGTDPQSEFDRFEQNIKMVSAVMKYRVPDVCSAILGQLRGRAADIGRSLIGTENTYADLNEFMMRLRSLFVSPAYQEKARAAFLTRIQKPRESIIAYHGILKVLWDKAYHADEKKEITLIRQFIAGVRSTQINERLHLDQPGTYQDVLDRALQLEGTYEVISLEARRREQNGQGSTLTHSIPLGGRGADPMDVGTLGQGKRPFRGNYRKPTYNPQRGRFTSTRGTYYPGRPRNTNFQYPTRPNQSSRGGIRRGFVNNHSPTWRTTKPFVVTQSDTCRACGEKGHWAKECPNRQQNPRMGNTNYVSPKTQMTTRRVGAPPALSRRPPKPNGVMAIGPGPANRYSADSDDTEAKNLKPWMQQ